ncbi:MAG TPA: hypothetical protein VGF35_03165 [Steroidobacteraceae bacterium]
MLHGRIAQAQQLGIERAGALFRGGALREQLARGRRVPAALQLCEFRGRTRSAPLGSLERLGELLGVAAVPRTCSLEAREFAAEGGDQLLGGLPGRAQLFAVTLQLGEALAWLARRWWAVRSSTETASIVVSCGISCSGRSCGSAAQVSVLECWSSAACIAAGSSTGSSAVLSRSESGVTGGGDMERELIEVSNSPLYRRKSVAL